MTHTSGFYFVYTIIAGQKMLKLCREIDLNDLLIKVNFFLFIF